MDSPLLNMPDDPDMIPGWLEGMLLSPLLDRLVTELGALHPPAAVPRLVDVLEPLIELPDDLQNKPTPRVRVGLRPASMRAMPEPVRFLEDGLVALPATVVNRLLQHPTLLLEVRDRVLADGGAYWDRYIHTPESTAAAGRVGEGVRHRLFSGEATPDKTAAAVYLDLAEVVSDSVWGAPRGLSIWLQNLGQVISQVATRLSGPHRDWLMSRLEDWSTRLRPESREDDEGVDSIAQTVRFELLDRADLLRGPTRPPPAD